MHVDAINRLNSAQRSLNQVGLAHESINEHEAVDEALAYVIPPRATFCVYFAELEAEASHQVVFKVSCGW